MKKNNIAKKAADVREETSLLPPGYTEGVSRVSDIVSFVHPFEGNAKMRYQQWLKKSGIAESDYLEEAQTVGTFIHQQMEDYIQNKPLQTGELADKHRLTIEWGKNYIYNLRQKFKSNIKWVPEPVVKDNKGRMQGSVDLVRVNEKTKTVWIYDYKTWGIAKERWNLKNEYLKPYSKLKKVKLQMSLYAYLYKQLGYSIGGIYGVWLHKSGCYEYSLELVPDAEIEAILAAYKANKKTKSDGATITIPNLDNLMEIEILEATKEYSNVKVKMDLEKADNALTTEQNLDEAIKAAKYLVKKLKK